MRGAWFFSQLLGRLSANGGKPPFAERRLAFVWVMVENAPRMGRLLGEGRRNVDEWGAGQGRICCTFAADGRTMRHRAFAERQCVKMNGIFMAREVAPAIAAFDPQWLLYEDEDMIMVNKPATIPVQKDTSGDVSLLELTQVYCGHALQLIHRIDRPVSGAIIMAKHQRAAVRLFEQFEQRTVEKHYYAIIDQRPVPEKGTLVHYIGPDSRYNRSVAHPAPGEGRKKAVLDYELVGMNDRFFLLKVVLHTGRHHQIRVQLKAMGWVIRGDAKYGYKRSNKDRSINLHARLLQVAQPLTGKPIRVVAPYPNEPIWSSFKAITMP